MVVKIEQNGATILVIVFIKVLLQLNNYSANISVLA